MKIDLIRVPYDSAQRGARTGAGRVCAVAFTVMESFFTESQEES
jgi:hypothetical protein